MADRDILLMKACPGCDELWSTDAEVEDCCNASDDAVDNARMAFECQECGEEFSAAQYAWDHICEETE